MCGIIGGGLAMHHRMGRGFLEPVGLLERLGKERGWKVERAGNCGREPKRACARIMLTRSDPLLTAA
jgi:hypothetical protein